MGSSGKHKTPRRHVPSEHWDEVERIAQQFQTTGPRLVERLISETLSDTAKAERTCARIRLLVEESKQ
jgi:hypothetical protein